MKICRNPVKAEYENALQNSGSHSIKLSYTQTRENRLKHRGSENIIWFNPPYSQNVITGVAKRFVNFLDHDFPKSNKLHKIFGRNTVMLATHVEKTSPPFPVYTTRNYWKIIAKAMQPNQHALKKFSVKLRT